MSHFCSAWQRLLPFYGMFLPLAELQTSEVGKSAGGTDPSSVRCAVRASLGGGVILVLVPGQTAPNQAPEQPKEEVKTTLGYGAARNGRGFTGVLGVDEGGSGEVRKSQVGDNHGPVQIALEHVTALGQSHGTTESQIHGIT